MFSITSENICGFNSKSELRNSSLTFIVRVCGSTRSEEHTSELQSRLHLVCRLLLEKKKTYPSTINVAGTAGTIIQVVLKLNGCTHTYPDDVDGLMVSPTEQKRIVLSGSAGADVDNN